MPSGQDPAAVHDRDVVAGLLDLGQQVARDEDRPTGAGQGRQQVADFHDAGRIQPVDRFVEDDDRGVGKEGLGDAQPLAHPGGVALDRARPDRGQVDLRKDARDPIVDPAARPAQVVPTTRRLSRPDRWG